MEAWNGAAQTGAARPAAPPDEAQAAGGKATETFTLGLRALYAKIAGRASADDDAQFDAYRRGRVPRRPLTYPHEGVRNNRHDNLENELICRKQRPKGRPGSGRGNLAGARSPLTRALGFAGDTLGCQPGAGDGPSFEIVDRLGSGSFGQVFRCRSRKTGRLVAIKVVKNCASYSQQALIESQIARALNANQRSPHIVHLFGDFTHLSHVCLVFELLSMNLYELLKQNQFRGLPLASVRLFAMQIVAGLVALDCARVVHCDLKPENILLAPADVERFCAADKGNLIPPSVVKIIDFGSASIEGRATHAYVQSRFYRAPEVLVGARYDAAIDMWSCGCVCAELVLGLPVFPGVSAHNQITRIVEMLGPPPDEVLARGADTEKYFDYVHKNTRRPPDDADKGTKFSDDDDADAERYAEPYSKSAPLRARHSPGRPQPPQPARGSSYVLKTPEEYSRDSRTSVPRTKKYFQYRTLPEIIAHYPVRRGLSPAEADRERDQRRVFSLFAAGLLEQAPHRRWTPRQALQHPFLTARGDGAAAKNWAPPPDARADERRHLQWGLRAAGPPTPAYDAARPPMQHAGYGGPSEAATPAQAPRAAEAPQRLVSGIARELAAQPQARNAPPLPPHPHPADAQRSAAHHAAHPSSAPFYYYYDGPPPPQQHYYDAPQPPPWASRRDAPPPPQPRPNPYFASTYAQPPPPHAAYPAPGDAHDAVYAANRLRRTVSFVDFDDQQAAPRSGGAAQVQTQSHGYSYTAGAPSGYLGGGGVSFEQTDFSCALQRPHAAHPYDEPREPDHGAEPSSYERHRHGGGSRRGSPHDPAPRTRGHQPAGHGRGAAHPGAGGASSLPQHHGQHHGASSLPQHHGQHPGAPQQGDGAVPTSPSGAHRASRRRRPSNKQQQAQPP